tara:strand:- start:146 stop:901 length:756 start_codon:yes stop_codon:yes gene_type:complete
MLSNKTFIVLGSCGLIGKSVITSILENNGNVIAIDKNKNLNNDLLKSFDKFKNNIEILTLDIKNEAELKKVLLQTNNLDGLVNCTYLKNKNYGTEFLKVSINEFNDNINLGLGSFFLVAQLCVKRFKKYKKPFNLVNIGSIYGVISPKFRIYKNTNMVPPVEYSAIKSALIHLTKYIAKYVNNSKFRCNCVSPGGIDDKQPKVFKHRYRKNTFGKGLMDPKDTSNLITFLLSDKSRSINGQNIIIDDGFTL